MAEITSIETQKKNKDRVNVFLNNEYAFSMNYDLLLKNNLKVGQEVNEETLKQLVLDNEKSLALSRCANLLGKNLKTEQQMKKYLLDLGYDHNVSNYVLNKLKEYNYINDENYVNIYIRSVKNKYGKLKIQSMLKQKGISNKIIDLALENFVTSDDELVNLSKKYLKNKEITQENMLKLSRYLLSKGYEFNEVNSIIKKFRSGDVNSWD